MGQPSDQQRLVMNMTEPGLLCECGVKGGLYGLVEGMNEGVFDELLRRSLKEDLSSRG